MSARFFLPAVILVPVALVAGCGGRQDNDWQGAKPGQKRILAVTPALYCFASSVGGDKAAVQCLLADKGPHDYEPTAADNLKARGADLFVANGLELDDFVTKIAISSGNKGVKIVKLGDLLDDKDLRHMEGEEHDEKDHKHEEGKEEEGHHHHGEHDPHVWLSPVHAKKLSALLAKELSKLDADNKASYQANAKTYGDKMDQLLAEAQSALSGKKHKTLVSMHDSMGYFADAVGVEIVDVIQPKAGLEAEAGQLAEIAKKCKEKEVRVICVEPQYPKGPAQTLQNHLKGQGLDVKLVVFDPMETVAPGETLDAGYYERRMRENIKNLAEALE